MADDTDEPKAAFRFLPGDQVEYVFGGPGPDTYSVQIESDDGGDSVVIREGGGNYGKGHRTKLRSVSRKQIGWWRGSAVSTRFHQWQMT